MITSCCCLPKPPDEGSERLTLDSSSSGIPDWPFAGPDLTITTMSESMLPVLTAKLLEKTFEQLLKDRLLLDIYLESLRDRRFTMASHRTANFEDRPYIDPNPLPSSVPHVDELGVTSAPLKSAAFAIGEYCKDVNGMMSLQRPLARSSPAHNKFVSASSL